jgi:hypothetical protein
MATVGNADFLEVKLWTDNTQELPWTDSFVVDTMPLQLQLEAHIDAGLEDVLWNSRLSTCGLA